MASLRCHVNKTSKYAFVMAYLLRTSDRWVNLSWRLGGWEEQIGGNRFLATANIHLTTRFSLHSLGTSNARPLETSSLVDFALEPWEPPMICLTQLLVTRTTHNSFDDPSFLGAKFPTVEVASEKC